MNNYKVESSNQQAQLDKIRKEMDTLTKEYRQSNVNILTQNIIFSFIVQNVN